MTPESVAPAVDKRKLGTSGIEVSVVGLGCNNFGGRTDFAATQAVVHRALDLGVTLFDTADVYGNKGGSEDFLGRILGARRKDVVLATKFGMTMKEPRSGGASRRYVVQAAEASLQRLRTDWIDLYQVHYPDPNTPIEDTLRALDELMQAGKVRAIGCSNFSAAKVAAALDQAAQFKRPAFVTCQDEYSLLVRDIEADLVPLMCQRGLSLLPYAPLASGFLTGKYRRREPLPAGARLSYSRHHSDDIINERNWTIVERLGELAARGGHTVLELAVGWLLAKPVVASVIAGATHPEQIEQNVAAAARVPAPAVVVEIDAITR
jgi:aryl-alcohol dehydrogenase-like predicted oxidoreductase